MGIAASAKVHTIRYWKPRRKLNSPSNSQQPHLLLHAHSEFIKPRRKSTETTGFEGLIKKTGAGCQDTFPKMHKKVSQLKRRSRLRPNLLLTRVLLVEVLVFPVGACSSGRIGE